MSKRKLYTRIFVQLLRRDFLIFRKVLPNKLIDTSILVLGNLIIFTYIFPMRQVGGEQFDFALFILGGSIFLFSFFDALAHTTVTVSDIEGDRTILHTLTLPIPSTLTFLQIATSWALHYGLATLIVLPLAKLTLLSRFDMSQVNWLKFALIYVTAYIFFGAFFLWLTSLIRRINSLAHIFIRVGNPMFMFGGYFFAWSQAEAIAPWFAKVILINPLLYAFEGMRAVIVGGGHFISLYVCISVLLTFSLVMGVDGICRLKRRLDCR